MSLFKRGLFGGSVQSGGGGGSGTGWDGRVDTFADLPDATLNTNKYYMVDTATGTVGADYKSAGIYKSNGSTWNLNGTPPLTSLMIGGILVSAAVLGVFGSSTIKVTPDAINGTMTIEGNYTAGDGLGLSENTFSLDASVDDLNDVSTTGALSGQHLVFNGSSWVPQDATGGGGTSVIRSIGATFNGGGSTIEDGTHVSFRFPYNMTISAVTVLADTVGNATFDIKVDSENNFTNATSIVASAPPSINGELLYRDTALTGWTTSVQAGDVIHFSVNGTATNVTLATVSVEGQ